jgi:hypothetical protein
MAGARNSRRISLEQAVALLIQNEAALLQLQVSLASQMAETSRRFDERLMK